jgi:DNA polymerase-3 subunit epsilon
LIKAESKKINLPNKLESSNYDKLPNEIGVYYFYSEDGSLLYIGKSKDIKKRVLSHFRVDLKRAKDIQLKNQIARIEYKLTGNELAALLFESHEIKTLRPKFNHALKPKLFPIALELKKNKKGVFEFKIFTHNPNEKHHFLFKNKKAAKRRVDSYYKSLLGHDQDHFNFIKAKSNFIEKFGIEQYNQMLVKIMNQKLPSHSDFDIKLSGVKKNESCLISVRKHLPAGIIYIDNYGEIREEINLYQDQDMIGILQSYLTKKKLSIVPIKNNFDIYSEHES